MSSTAKDALAWTILHGGYAVAKVALTTGAVAAGLLDKGTAKQLSKMIAKMSPHFKRDAWSHYERTGSIWEMVQIAVGSDVEVGSASGNTASNQTVSLTSYDRHGYNVIVDGDWNGHMSLSSNLFYLKYAVLYKDVRSLSRNGNMLRIDAVYSYNVQFSNASEAADAERRIREMMRRN